MTMEQTIYELVKYLNCVFEVFLFYYFLESLFPVYEEHKKRIWLEIVAAASIIYGVNVLRIPTANLISVFLVYSCLTWLVFRKNLKIMLPYMVFCIILLASTEFIIHYIFYIIKIKYQETAVEGILVLFIQGILRFLIIEMLRKKNSDNWSYSKEVMGYMKYILLLPIATIVFWGGIVYFDYFPIGYGLICLGGLLLVVSNIGGFFIIRKMLEVINSANEAELRTMKTQLEQKHYQRIEEINQEYAQYAHEIKKAARTVQQLAEQGNHREISQVAAQLQKSGAAFSKKIYCSDILLNAILLERQKIAEQQHMDFSVNIQQGTDFKFVDELDRIVLFGNLLDNAMEAASKAENGYIQVDSYMANEALLIFRVENNFKIAPKRKGSEYLSAKKEKGHGYGLKNVKEAAEKYGGFLYLEEESDRFIAVLTLSNMRKEMRSH